MFFNTNVQALVHVVDIDDARRAAGPHVNLNAQIKTETQPTNPTESLDRLFGNDLVDDRRRPDLQNFLLVSRGGNYVLRAGLDAEGKLDIGAPDNVVRFQTGQHPDRDRDRREAAAAPT